MKEHYLDLVVLRVLRVWVDLEDQVDVEVHFDRLHH